MMRILPFGAPSGFSDLPIPGAHYYSQGFTPSLMGLATLYSIQNKIDSAHITGGTASMPKYFAIGPSGAQYAQDDSGNILKETTPSQCDFAIVHAPGGNGAGLLGDQFGNLLYATPSQLGIYNGSSWNDSYQSLDSGGTHPMDTYEDLRLIANNSAIAVLYSDGTFNSSAFTLPSGMKAVAAKGGPTGILVGANFGYQGAIILWDGVSTRSKTSWKWFNGQIMSIIKYGENWLVETQRGVYVTNGYTVRELFGVFDDPLAFRSYENSEVFPQRMAVVNDMLIFTMAVHANGPASYEFGKMKPGVYLYSISRKTWNYIPLATGNSIKATISSVFVDVNYNNRIFIGYKDHATNLSYIAELTNTPPTRAQFISEPLGSGRVKGQRGILGPTEKIAEAVVLNLSMLNSATDPMTGTFSVALKIYNFKRQLWGKQFTNAALSNQNQLRVDGTNTAYSKARVGDEVTVLSGVNAGQIAHITSIANAGTNTETWTLDTTFPNITENTTYLQVQPFQFVQKQSFSNLAEMKRIFFNLNTAPRGKEFLLKVVIEGMGTNLALEMNTGYFVFDDLGYDAT